MTLHLPVVETAITRHATDRQIKPYSSSVVRSVNASIWYSGSDADLRPVRVPELDRPVGACGQERALHVAAPGQRVDGERVACEALLVPGQGTTPASTRVREPCSTAPAASSQASRMHALMKVGVACRDPMCCFVVTQEEDRLRTAALWPWSTGGWRPPPCPARTPAPVPATFGL